MLAIQCVNMYWTKENRTPEGSVMRKAYYAPTLIDSSVALDKDNAEYFLQKRFYIQKDKIYTTTEYNRLYGNRYINAKGSTEAQEKEKKRKYLLDQNRMEQENLGSFYSDVDTIQIPGIEILKEEDAYRIRWYSLEHGYQPVRRGYDEKGWSRDIKCETAFILDKGEAGKIEYNYRYTGYYGQHYEQYCVYFINTEQITHDSFVKANYEKVYSELADLF